METSRSKAKQMMEVLPISAMVRSIHHSSTYGSSPTFLEAAYPSYQVTGRNAKRLMVKTVDCNIGGLLSAENVDAIHSEAAYEGLLYYCEDLASLHLIGTCNLP